MNFDVDKQSIVFAEKFSKNKFIANKSVNFRNSGEQRMNVEEIVQQILLRHQDLILQDVMKDIENKKINSGGLLTTEAAARLVAAEHGLEVIIEKPVPKVHIHQLVPGLNDVTVLGRVLLVDNPRIFSVSEGDRQVARLLIADKTEKINVVLWNEKAEFARKVKQDQIVKVLHGYVRQSRRGELELHVGERGEVEIASNQKEAEFPFNKDITEKINTITVEHKKVNVEGYIEVIYPKSTFQRSDGTQGEVMRIILKDETGRIPIVFWNEKTEAMINVKEGANILLINTKVRKKNKDESLELHVDNFAKTQVRY